MLKYRPEIDGLRAVAVVPVILFHAGFNRFFAGGYIGVDIFFVISGYLITSVILKECNENKFSLIHFYERRCRRILPALFLIVFLNGVFAYRWMLPDQLKEFSQTLLSILCISSNFFFWWKDDGYFSQLSELNPLVHTWSLAVEEQFYFIFPILCSCLNEHRRLLITILFLSSVASFSLAQWGDNIESLIKSQPLTMFAQHRLTTFYLPFGRIWELLFGSLAAFYLISDVELKKFLKKSREIFSIFGLSLILVSIVFLDNEKIPPFPNCYTLLPSVGTVLIIVFADETTMIGRILSSSFFQSIGLISYSVYLWHQPILAFLRLKTTEPLTDTKLLTSLGLVFPLSIISYNFVEEPFRKKSFLSRKKIFSFAILATAIAFLVALFLMKTAENRREQLSKIPDSYLNDLSQFAGVSYVIQRYEHDLSKFRTFSDSSMKKLVLIGDSFSQDVYNMIVEGNHLKNYQIRLHFIYARCQIFLGNEDRLKFIEKKHHQTCSKGNDIRNAFPLIRQANVILLATNWQVWSALQLPTTIQWLNLTKEQQVFVIGPKHVGDVEPKLYVNKTKEFRLKQRLKPRNQTTSANNILMKLLDPSIFVNLQKYLCRNNDGTCHLFTPEGKLISHDGAHLTKFGAIYLGNLVFRDKPLNKL